MNNKSDDYLDFWRSQQTCKLYEAIYLSKGESVTPRHLMNDKEEYFLQEYVEALLTDSSFITLASVINAERLNSKRRKKTPQDLLHSDFSREQLEQLYSKSGLSLSPILSPKKKHNNNQTTSTKESESMLKLIAGMAVGYYGYDPALKRSDVPKNIQLDIEKTGIRMDQDTIRKYLNLAKDLIPPKE